MSLTMPLCHFLLVLPNMGRCQFKSGIVFGRILPKVQHKDKISMI
jgi:hypothetical protein